MPFRPRPDRNADSAAAPEAHLRRCAAPPAGEANEAPPTPPLTQALEKKENREMNKIEPS